MNKLTEVSVKNGYRVTCNHYRKVVYPLFLILLILLLTAPVQAKYSGGTGEPNAPYLIADANQLNSISIDSNDWDKHFKLVADIDMNSVEYNVIAGSSEMWYFEGEPFTGSFDGGGYVIKNLTINNLNQSYIGLFGCIGTDGEIKNLALENFNLTGFAYVGAVAGENKGSIINCFSEVDIQVDYKYAGGITGENDGNISISTTISNVYGSAHLGGLIGWNNGNIDRCTSEGLVEVNVGSGGSCGGFVGIHRRGNISNSSSNSIVHGGSSDVGGFAGINWGTIENCHSKGDVSGTDWSTGGLVGSNGGEIYNSSSTGDVNGKYDIGGSVGLNSYGDIINSCATGNVYGLEEVGGLTGWNNRGEIMNCYSTGDVNGIEYIGGLSGGISSAGHIINCYVTGKVFGNINTGGLLGYIVNNQGGLTKSFWDTDKNPDINGVGNVSDPNVIGLPTFLMQMRSTFVDAGWDFNTPVWTIDEGVDYPRLWWEMPIEPVNLIAELSESIDTMSLQKGITNSLHVKLDIALQLLEDENEHNDVAAINSLQAFINAVNAQHGKEISEEDADYLVTVAQQIIDLLSSE